MTIVTPMLRQYQAIKEQYSDCLLFFRLGDFYEMFNDDAKIAAKELSIVLTSRDSGNGNRMPMCGVPYHAANNYIARLIEKGYKVAICEQLEDPKLVKGLVKRDVIRVITPGTMMDMCWRKSRIIISPLVGVKKAGERNAALGWLMWTSAQVSFLRQN